jgi:DeoR/GlpR family transcriptional regulator of sugar metabolism
MARSRTFSNERVFEIMDGVDQPFVTINDLVDELDVQRSGIHKRLQAMRENGDVKKKKVGASAAVWWRDQNSASDSSASPSSESQ